MAGRTAIVKVVCHGAALEETAVLVAWAIGQRVVIRRPAGDMGFGWLLFSTELAFDGDGERFSRHFGFDIIGKIPGVLSWEVIPSDVDEAKVVQPGGTDPVRDVSRSLPTGPGGSSGSCRCRGRLGCRH